VLVLKTSGGQHHPAWKNAIQLYTGQALQVHRSAEPIHPPGIGGRV
jgi:hypothetical protein